jgi:hypothetical protein
MLPFFFLKTPDIIFSVMQKPFKNACFLWGLTDFYVSEKILSGVLKKTAALVWSKTDIFRNFSLRTFHIIHEKTS